MTAASKVREELEAAIWGVCNTGDVPPAIRHAAAMAAAGRYANAVAVERIAQAVGPHLRPGISPVPDPPARIGRQP
jgi:hypothetical protein